MEKRKKDARNLAMPSHFNRHILQKPKSTQHRPTETPRLEPINVGLNQRDGMYSINHLTA
jgi:hypothetical protein